MSQFVDLIVLFDLNSVIQYLIYPKYLNSLINSIKYRSKDTLFRITVGILNKVSFKYIKVCATI